MTELRLSVGVGVVAAVLNISLSGRGSVCCMLRLLRRCGLLDPGSPFLLDRTQLRGSRRGAGLEEHSNGMIRD
jgi:hypothetical protein